MFWRKCQLPEVGDRGSFLSASMVEGWEVSAPQQGSLHGQFPSHRACAGTGHVLAQGMCWKLKMKVPVLVHQGCCNEGPRARGIQPEMYHLIVLGSRSLRSGCGESWLLLRALRKALIFASLPASDGSRLSLLGM